MRSKQNVAVRVLDSVAKYDEYEHERCFCTCGGSDFGLVRDKKNQYAGERVKYIVCLKCYASHAI